MIPQTFIFLGSSGCGKGTQLENVLKYLTLKDSQRKVVTLGMGDSFRTFWNEGGYTQAHSLEILKKGALQPSFIQIYLWTDFFVHNVTKETHLLVDGTPRRIEGSRAFDSALRFYSRVKPVVVYLKVSRQWAKKRLIERASFSDKPEKNNNLRNLEDGDDEKIEKRLDWFEEYSLPAIDFFRGKPEYTFIEVNGEQSIQEVRDEIIGRAFNSSL